MSAFLRQAPNERGPRFGGRFPKARASYSRESLARPHAHEHRMAAGRPNRRVEVVRALAVSPLSGECPTRSDRPIRHSKCVFPSQGRFSVAFDEVPLCQIDIAYVHQGLSFTVQA